MLSWVRFCASDIMGTNLDVHISDDLDNRTGFLPPGLPVLTIWQKYVLCASIFGTYSGRFRAVVKVGNLLLERPFYLVGQYHRLLVGRWI